MDRSGSSDSPERDAAGEQDGVSDVIQLPQGWQSITSNGPLAQVDAYWHALRGSGLVPARSDVDPRGIEGALSHAFIVERIAPGHARVRIAGQHFGDLLGMEVRGMPLSALFEPEARPQLQDLLRDLFDTPSICKMSLRAEKRIGKPAMTARLALYPLRNDLGDISRALGCVLSENEIGRAPRRFTITRAKAERLTPRRPVQWKDHGDLLPRAQGMAEAQKGFERTGVPYLRLVTSTEDD